MTTKINEKQKFNPAEELEATTLSPELQPLNEIATEIAWTKKETGKKLTHHKTQVQYKLLASNEVMVVEEKIFEGYKIPNARKNQFNWLEQSYKQQILKNFELAKNRWLDNKSIEKIVKSWIDFYHWYTQYVDFFNWKTNTVSSKSLELALKNIKSIYPEMVSDELLEKSIEYNKLREEIKIQEIDKSKQEIDKSKQVIEKLQQLIKILEKAN